MNTVVLKSLAFLGMFLVSWLLLQAVVFPEHCRRDAAARTTWCWK